MSIRNVGENVLQQREIDQEALACPRCGSTNFHETWHHEGKAGYWCDNCDRRFIAPKADNFYLEESQGPITVRGAIPIYGSIKERPICRAHVDKMIQEGHELEDIATGWSKRVNVSDGIAKQAARMLHKLYGDGRVIVLQKYSMPYHTGRVAVFIPYWLPEAGQEAALEEAKRQLEKRCPSTYP